MEEERRGRRLSLFDATMLVMGGIIGVGVFFAPGDVARTVGSPALFVTLWLAGGCVAMCGAATFAELGGTFPRAGGWFEFLREIYGPFVAFLFAWVILGVVATGAIAVIATFAAATALELCGLAAGGGAQLGLAAAILAVLTGLVACGIKVGATFQNLCMLAKLVALGALIAGGLAFFAPGAGAPAAAGLEREGSAVEGAVAAFLPVFFAFGGWQHLCYVAGDVADPRRNLPRAILLGVGGVAVVYALVNLAYLRVMGLDALATTPGFAGEVAERTLGAGGARALRAAMAVSAIGVCTVNVLVTPAIFVAMARSGLFFASFARLSARTGAPLLALATQLGLALGYLAWSHADVLLDVDPEAERMDPDALVASVVFAEWIFHGLVAYGLLRLRRRRPDLPRPYRSFLWPLAPVVYLAVAIVVLAGNLGTGPWTRSGVGIGVLALGALVYVPWRAAFARRAGAP